MPTGAPRLRLKSGPGSVQERDIASYGGAEYIRLPGTGGNYASTPDSAAIDITGDIDIRIRVALDDWTPVAFTTLFNKWTSNLSYLLRIRTDGRPHLFWSENGIDSFNLASDPGAVVPAADGAPIWVRATFDVDNGAAGHDVEFFTSDDGITWIQLGATRTGVGVTSIFNSSSPLIVGGAADGVTDPPAGKVYYAELRNGIDGPVVASFDPSDVDPDDTTTTTLLTSKRTGEVWTINRSGLARAMLQGFSPRATLSPAWGPSSPFTDSFDRSNSTSLGVDWTEDEWAAPVLQIVNNKIRTNEVFSVEEPAFGIGYYKDVVGTADQEVSLTFRAQSLPVGGLQDFGAGCFVRGSGEVNPPTTVTFNGYSLNYDGPAVGITGLRLQRHDYPSGSTTLWSESATLQDGDILRLRVVGSTLKAYLNDVLKAERVDSTYPSGRVGIFAFDTGDNSGGPAFFEWDNWTAAAIILPDATTGYEVLVPGVVLRHSGTAQAGTADSLTLAANAPSSILGFGVPPQRPPRGYALAFVENDSIPSKMRPPPVKAQLAAPRPQPVPLMFAVAAPAPMEKKNEVKLRVNPAKARLKLHFPYT